MAAWTEVEIIPNDEQRQQAFLTGVGDYGGNDQDYEFVRQTVMPSEES